MIRLFSILNRMLLTAGVLMALTPCGLCQKGFDPAVPACSMAHMGKMDCCHKGKSTNVFCKVMDQSSVSASSVHLDAPAMQAGPLVLAAFTLSQSVGAVPLTYSSSSPPPGLTPLRI